VRAAQRQFQAAREEWAVIETRLGSRAKERPSHTNISLFFIENKRIPSNHPISRR